MLGFSCHGLSSDLRQTRRHHNSYLNYQSPQIGITLTEQKINKHHPQKGTAVHYDQNRKALILSV